MHDENDPRFKKLLDNLKSQTDAYNAANKPVIQIPDSLQAHGEVTHQIPMDMPKSVPAEQLAHVAEEIPHNPGMLKNLEDQSAKFLGAGNKMEQFDHVVNPAKITDLSPQLLNKYMKTGIPLVDKAYSPLGNIARKASSLAPALLKALGVGGALYGMSQGDAFAADPTGMLHSEEAGKGSDVIPTGADHFNAVNDSRMDTKILPKAISPQSIDATQEPEERAKTQAFDALLNQMRQKP
jgi:hypothetical protein